MYSDYGLDTDEYELGWKHPQAKYYAERWILIISIGQGESTQQFFGDLQCDVPICGNTTFFIEAHHTYQQC